MKINFEIEDITITYGELYKFFNDKRNSDLVLPPYFAERKAGDLYGLFADAIKKNIDTTFHSASLDSPPIKDRDAYNASVYMTTNFAVGNQYKYPKTEEDSEIQDLLCFIQSGAFYLFVEQIEYLVGRKLDDVEQRFLIACLQDLTYTVYEEKHPENIEDPEE